MTLSALRAFVEAARCENFTQAAAALFVSQPSLSKQIAQLEQEVGLPLFERASRGVQLTPAGRFLYERWKDIPNLITHDVYRAKKIAAGATGDLCVGILEGQEIRSVILSRLDTFAREYPQLSVSLERETFSGLRRGLESGRYDLIITLSFEVDYIKGALQEVIIASKGVIAISRSNPKAGVKSLTLDMLADESFVSIAPEESPNGYALMVRQCTAHGFQPRIVRQHSSLESLLLSVEAGIGIAILDQNTRLKKGDSVRLVPIRGSDFSHISAVWLDSNADPSVRLLAQALRET